MTDQEYEEILSAKDEDIKKSLLENSKTTRTSKYYYAFDVARSLANKFRLSRIGDNDGRNYGTGQTIKHICKTSSNIKSIIVFTCSCGLAIFQ